MIIFWIVICYISSTVIWAFILAQIKLQNGNSPIWGIIAFNLLWIAGLLLTKI